jgi:dihydroxyacetone kinase phosphotransfer subunit
MVSLILLSHSPKIVEGVRDMALEMGGNDSNIFAIGGTKAGTLGADYDRIFELLQSAARAGEALVLTDLGSVRLTSEMAREALEPELQNRVFLSDAAIVEGALIAAVSIAAGDNAESVLKDLEEFNVPK